MQHSFNMWTKRHPKPSLWCSQSLVLRHELKSLSSSQNPSPPVKSNPPAWVVQWQNAFLVRMRSWVRFPAQAHLTKSAIYPRSATSLPLTSLSQINCGSLHSIPYRLPMQRSVLTKNTNIDGAKTPHMPETPHQPSPHQVAQQ